MFSKSFLLLCLCWLGWAAPAAGQNPANYRTFQVPVVYRLPPGQNGLTESAFQLAVSIRMERYATYSEAIVNIRPTQSTAQNPNPSYVHSYTYQGRRYGDQHLGPAIFVPVRARNLQYELKFSTSSHPLITKSREDGMDNLFGPLDKNLKASEITLYISVVGASFDNTSQIEERIRALTEQAASPPKPAATAASAPAATAKAGATAGASGGASNSRSSAAGGASSSGSSSGSGSSSNSGTTTSTARSATTATRPPAMTQQQAEQYAKDYLARDAASRQAKANAAVASDPLIQGLGALGAMMEREADEKAAARQLAREQRAREEEAREEEARAAAAEAARRRNLAAERRQLLGGYGNGKVPLTSQTIAGNELYFFCSSYQDGDLSDDAPTLYVSNAFPVARYGDGTWPFTKQLLADFTKATGKPVSELSGFYTTLAEAEQRLASLTERAEESGMSVRRITFKGKPSTGAGGADFWGNAPAKAAPAGHSPARPAATTDYWGNPTKPAGTPAPAATGQKPKAPAAKTDYWGNPIK